MATNDDGGGKWKKAIFVIIGIVYY